MSYSHTITHQGPAGTTSNNKANFRSFLSCCVSIEMNGKTFLFLGCWCQCLRTIALLALMRATYWPPVPILAIGEWSRVLDLLIKPLLTGRRGAHAAYAYEMPTRGYRLAHPGWLPFVVGVTEAWCEQGLYSKKVRDIFNILNSST